MTVLQSDPLPVPVRHFLEWLVKLLGSKWDLSVHDHLAAPRDGQDYLHSIACIARYGDNLVVHVNIDRSLHSVLVGTDQPGDIYPFEDVAVSYDCVSNGDLNAMIAADPGADDFRPLIPLQESLEFLASSADRLDQDFAPGTEDLRRRLGGIADSFQAAWDEAVQDRSDGQ